MFVCLGGLFSLTWGQNLDQRLDFTGENRSIPEVLDALAKASGLEIAYADNFFKNSPPISKEFKNEKLRTILKEILYGPGIEFKFSKGTILLYRPRTYTLSGFVLDEESGEALVGASIHCRALKRGTFANEYGFFSITLPKGTHDLEFRYVGYLARQGRYDLDENLEHKVEMKPDLQLQIVKIFPEAAQNSVPFSLPGQGIQLNPGWLKASPALGGLEDPVRAAQILPGVEAGGDGLAGLHIRGGDPGHNLMLMDGAPVFIPFHLLGLYSIYNSSTIKSAQLHRGTFSARYGGRLGSVLDVRTREGDLNRWHGGASYNLNLGEVFLEGPFQRTKGSVLASFRGAPASTFLFPVFDRTYFKGVDGALESNYWDLNFKVNYVLGQKDRLYVSAFASGDSFGKEEYIMENGQVIELENELEWSNRAISLRWNHQFSNKLFANTLLTYSRFDYINTTLEQFTSPDTSARDGLFFVDSQSRNTHLGIQTDFDYHPSEQHQMRFGGGIAGPWFTPTFIYLDEDSDELSQLETINVANIRALTEEEDETREVMEGHVYLEDKIQLSEVIETHLGMRATLFSNDDTQFIRPEPRASMMYKPGAKTNFYVSGSRMVQYLHLISNSDFRFPNDIWVVSSAGIAPQSSWILEAGTGLQISNRIYLGMDFYYKYLDNLNALPDSAASLDNLNLTNPENLLTQGKGQAMGAELTATFQGDDNRGMFSYTLAKSERKFPGINMGETFFHAFDRRHQFKSFFAQQFGKRWQVGINGLYLSSSPRLNLLNARSSLGFLNAMVDPPREKHETRSKAYHRLDLNVSYTLTTGPIIHRLKIGLYNVYGRENISFYDYTLGTVEPVYGIPRTPSISYFVKF